MSDEVLQNIFNQAKLALSNDARTKLYNTMQNRTTAFRQINQQANARHAMFSGMPAAMQMQKDASFTIPTGVKIVSDAAQQMQQNQEAWNEYLNYVKKLNASTSELERAMKK